MRTLVLLSSLVFLGLPAAAFGPGAHAYLAMRAMGTDTPVAPFAATLPDLNGAFHADPQAEGRIKHLTHFEFNRLRPSCFAAGFATHNNAWGADSIAHAYFVPDAPDNYVTRKLHELSARCGISLHEAEDLFDAGIDLALARDVGPSLGQTLAASARSAGAQDEEDLVAAFAAPLSEATTLTPEEAGLRLRWAQRAMKSVMTVYGVLLQQPLPKQKPIAVFFVGRVFHWTPEEARTRLDAAIELAADCRPALDAMAGEIRERLLADPAYADCVERIAP